MTAPVAETSSRALTTGDLRLGFSEATELAAAIRALTLQANASALLVASRGLDGTDLLDLNAEDVIGLVGDAHPDATFAVRRVWQRVVLPQWEYATNALGRELRALSQRLDTLGRFLLLGEILRGAMTAGEAEGAVPLVTALVPSVFLPTRVDLARLPSGLALSFRVGGSTAPLVRTRVTGS